MSEQVGGGLGFVATLDINDFNVSAEAMNRRIRNVSNTAMRESEAMEQSIASFAQNGARYIVGTLVGGGMMQLVNSIVQTRGQFQQLEIAFETMLGSGSKSKELMNQLVMTAAKTPFSLQEVAGGAKQLLAYGDASTKVNDDLKRLGNIASGLSIPLNDIIYLYGTSMVQGRLYAQDVRQFTGRGIPLVKELASMYGKSTDEINAMVSAGKVGFDDVEKVIRKMTDSGGQFYNLMEKQSHSLTGMISNLGDAWDKALNKIGTDNQGIFEGAIGGATYFVEHMDEVLRIVEAVAIAYGSYKAAVMLNTLATKGYTGVSLLDNTVRQAKLALMQGETLMSGKELAMSSMKVVSHQAETTAMEAQLTVEERANVVRVATIASIEGLLTAQQKEALSLLGLTTTSEGYAVAAMETLTVQQREALSKMNITQSSAVYRAALQQEVMAKTENNAATIASMREDVKAAALKMESAKASAVSAIQSVEAARYEVYWAKQSGDATRIATAEKRLEGAIENQALSRKAALSASTDFYAKKKNLETTATMQSTVASRADTVAKEGEAVATTVLGTVTNALTTSVKALWASMMANPLGSIVSLLGIAYSAYEMFFKKQEDGTETISGLAKATKDANEEFGKQASKVDTLQKIVSDGNIAYLQRNKALDELKQIIPGYHAQLTKEGKLINDNTEAIQVYLTQLEKQIKLKAAQDELEAAYKKKRTLEKTESSQSDKYWDIKQTNTLQGYNRNSVPAKLSRLFGIEKEGNAKKDLDQTQNDLKDVNNTITELNNEITSTTQSMNESTGSVRTYSQQVSDAQKQILSLKNELKDLRSGKVKNADLATAIEEKTKELKDAESKLSALTGKNDTTTKSENDAATKAQQLAEKQIQAELKATQSRIDAMEEGYEKRKATLDLQHKQSLVQIDKDERELAKARKEAGKGGLSADEKSDFKARRANENEVYLKAQNKLFDGEIEYKKSQYELYWRWVKNMGKGVANERFKDLMASGDSYKSYVENEIKKLTVDDGSALNDRKGVAGLSEGEVNYLLMLKNQLSEISGQKSALDNFKDSFTQAISRAATLAEKMKVIADYKDKINNNTAGLVGKDDAAKGLLFINTEDTQFNAQLDERTRGVLEHYMSIDKKKRLLETKYNEDIALLDNARKKASTQEEIANIDETKRYRKESFEQELSELDNQILKSSEFYSRFFEDASRKGYATLKTFASQINKLLDDAIVKKNSSGESIVEIKIPTVGEDGKQSIKTLTVTMEMLASLKNKSNEFNKELTDRNPFKKLADGIKKLDAEIQKGSKGKGAYGDALEDISAGFKESIETVGKWSESLGSILGDGSAQALKEIQTFVTGASDIGFGIGRIATGDVVGGITESLSGIASVYKTITGWQEKQEAHQRKMYLSEIEYQRLLRERNYELEQSTAYIEAYAKEQELLSWLIQKGFVKDGSSSKFSILGNQYKVAMASLKEETKIYEDLLSKIRSQGEATTGMQYTGSLTWEETKYGLKYTTEEMLRQYDAQGMLTGSTKEWYDAWVAAGSKISELTPKISELKEQMSGLVLGSSFDDFLGGVMDTLSAAKGDISNFGNFTEETIKKALLNSFKYKIMSDAIKPLYDKLATQFLDNDKISSDWAKSWSEELKNALGSKYTELQQYFKDAGMDLSTLNSTSPSSSDSLAGAIKGMSEETGGVVAGRLNAVIINQSDGLSLLRQSILIHQQIAANTGASASELKEIKDTLKRIEVKDSSLLSKGYS